jgi:hypothetical protein
MARVNVARQAQWPTQDYIAGNVASMPRTRRCAAAAERRPHPEMPRPLTQVAERQPVEIR